MARPKFFYDGEFLLNSEVVLSEVESRHAIGARRLRVSDEVVLLNGQGGKATADLLDMSNRKALVVKITATENIAQAEYVLEIATAIPKGDRQKVMLDMLTQIGVTHITPLECEHSVTSFKDNIRQRWQRNLIESSKQCERAWLPVINDAVAPAQLIEQRGEGLVMYADITGDVISDLFVAGESNVLVLIGPEGGFSDNELAMFENQKIASIALAQNILRTEAAAITAAAQLINLL